MKNFMRWISAAVPCLLAAALSAPAAAGEAPVREVKKQEVSTARKATAEKADAAPAKKSTAAPAVEAAGTDKADKNEKKRGRNEKEKLKELAPEKPAALTPVAVHKTGRALHDRIVDFERVLCSAQKLFEVAEDVRHDYVACAKKAEALAKLATRLKTIHDERLRFHGREYHYDLELLELDAQRLREAVAEHRRARIFEYWYKLLRMRRRLIASGGWK